MLGDYSDLQYMYVWSLTQPCFKNVYYMTVLLCVNGQLAITLLFVSPILLLMHTVEPVRKSTFFF